MKNKVFVFIILAMASLSGMGQYVSETVDGSSIMPNSGKLMFVRDCPTTNYSLSFVAEDTSVYALWTYAFTSGSPYAIFQVKKIKMPLNIRMITDMCAVDSIVFFCGYDTSGTCIIGYFDLLHLSLGPLLYPPHMVTTYQITAVSSWDKIAVCKLNGNYHVYAIGQFYYNIGHVYKSTIVEIRNATTANSYNYVHLSSTLPYYSERIDDIVFTDNWTVFVGRDNYNHQPDRHLSMRKIGKNQDLYATDFNTLHYYTPKNEYNSSVCAIHTTRNVFIVAYAALSATNPENYPVKIRAFNANNMNNTSSSKYYTYQKTNMYGLTYNSGADLLTILHSKGLTTTFTIVTPPGAMFPYNYGYSDATTDYSSVDIVSTTQIIATSKKKWFLQDISPTVDHGCFVRSTYPVLDESNLTHDSDVSQLGVFPNGITPVYSFPFSITTHVLNASCSQQ